MILNKAQEKADMLAVVNCIQNCIFTYDSQLEFKAQINEDVVNCIQNCIFTYDSQPSITQRLNNLSCELHSKLYFYL